MERSKDMQERSTRSSYHLGKKHAGMVCFQLPTRYVCSYLFWQPCAVYGLNQ